METNYALPLKLSLKYKPLNLNEKSNRSITVKKSNKTSLINRLHFLYFLFSLVFLTSFSGNAWGQCTNTTSYSSMAAPAAGNTSASGTTNYREYNSLTGVVAGATYISNHITQSNNTYITIHSGTYNGPVVAHGYAPLVWTAIANGQHYVHYNLNNSCATSTSTSYNYQGITGRLQTYTTCSMTWTDAQGGSNYQNQGAWIYTFYPATVGAKVSVTFNSFATEDRYDGMMIYNGNSTAAPLISSGRTDGVNLNTCKNGAWSGTGSPGTVTSTAADGSLTFVFTSDQATNKAGWSASVTCTCTPSTPPTSITSSAGPEICLGQSTTLTSVGGTNGDQVAHVWYQGGAPSVAYTNRWDVAPGSIANTTVNSVTNGILNVTSTSADPMINMYSLGSFNPNTYKYINVRYRVVSGSPGQIEIFFTNATYSGANANQRVPSSPLVTGGAWHVMSIDMSTHASWTSSNVTGWRYDWATANGVVMEIDFIELATHPAMDTDGSATITVNPTTTTTYFARKIDNCQTSTTCASVTVTVNSVPTTPVISQAAPASCYDPAILSTATLKPVAYYKFNGDLKDYSGNGLDLTKTGSVNAGYSDGGLQLEPGMQFSSPNNSYLSGNEYYTIAFDYKHITNNGATWAKIFTWAPTGNRSPGIFTYNPDIGFHWRHDPNSKGVNYNGAITLDPGRWYHVVGVRKGTLFRLYIDGVMVESATLDPGTTTGNVPFVFGEFSGNPAPTKTVIKEFKIYDQAIEWFSGSCGGTFISSTPEVKVNPNATTTYYARISSPCGTSACGSSTVTRPISSTAPTSASNDGTNNTYCYGDAITLTSNGGTNGAGAVDVWYAAEGELATDPHNGCDENFVELWNSFDYNNSSYYYNHRNTDYTVSNGIISVKNRITGDAGYEGGDPHLWMFPLPDNQTIDANL